MNAMKKLGNWIKKNVLLIFIGVIILMIIVYIANFHNGFSSSDNSWGNFGSYFGSFTGLLAFGGVLYTAWQSEKRAEEEKVRREQAEQHTKDVEKKVEEDSIKREERDLFFKLLDLHQENLKSVIYADDKSKENGLSSFEKYAIISNNYLYDYSIDFCIIKKSIDDLIQFEQSNLFYDKEIRSRCQYIYDRIPDEVIQDNMDRKGYYEKIKKNRERIINNPIVYSNSNANTDRSRYIYFPGIYSNYEIPVNNTEIYLSLKYIGNVINVKYGAYIGKYFRNMYYILETCNKFKYDNEYYFKLYRAQLSENEIIMCLLNAVSDKSSQKFVKLLNDNEILDGLYYRDLVSIKFDDKYKGKELEFVEDMLNLYLEEHKEPN